jgi:hypothetical protein
MILLCNLAHLSNKHSPQTTFPHLLALELLWASQLAFLHLVFHHLVLRCLLAHRTRPARKVSKGRVKRVTTRRCRRKMQRWI